MFGLKVYRDHLSGDAYEVGFQGDVMTIGRDPDNDLRIRQHGVSRHHARIERIHGEFWLVDTGSTNGTWIGNTRIDRTRMRPGQSFRINDTRMELIQHGVTNRPVGPMTHLHDQDPAGPMGLGDAHNRNRPSPIPPPPPKACPPPPPNPGEHAQGCPSCGRPTPAQTVFCDFCGCPIRGVTASLLVCQACRTRAEPGDRYCAFCGYHLHATNQNPGPNRCQVPPRAH